MIKRLLSAFIFIPVIFYSNAKAQCGTAVQSITEAFNASTMPACWTPSGSAAIVANQLQITSSGGTNSLVVLPMTTNAKGILTFSAQRAWNYEISSVQVGVVSSPTNLASFTLLQTVATAYTMASYTVNLSSYTGSYKYIVLRLVSLSAGNPSRRCVIDNVNYTSGCESNSVTAVAKDFTIQLGTSGTANLLASQVNDGSFSDCGAPTLAVNISSFDCSDIGVQTVTLTATDNSGNTSTATANVTVTDALAPVPNLSSLATINGQCEITFLTVPTATDNCSGTITATHNMTLPITSTTTVIWTYTDGNGNSINQHQAVVINDNTAPVANLSSLPALSAQCEITSLTAPTATDNCEGVITGTHSATLPITASTTLTWTYDDGNGNSSTQNQTIVINDYTVPVANLASLPTLSSQCGITSLTAPTATDNCAGVITGTHSATLPITASTTLTWTYDDGNGNSTTQDQAIVINDNTVPLANIFNLPTLSSQCAITSLTAPTATDNCTGVITGTHNATLPITATTTVLWTYNDGKGNISTQTQEIVIVPIDNSTSVTGATITATQTGATYQWVDCDNANTPVPNATAQSFSAAISGNYAVQITMGGCTETSSCVFISAPLGIDTKNISHSITIYPNPASTTLTVQTDGYIESIYIYDISGKLIQTESNNTFSIAQLPSGIYTVQISTSKGWGINRLLKK